MERQQPKIQLVDKLLGDPYLRRAVDPKNPHNIRERAKSTLSALKPLELQRGAATLISSLSQEQNPDTTAAEEIRTTARSLLDLVVGWGTTKGIPSAYYADQLTAAIHSQQEKLSRLEGTGQEHKASRIHENIQALLHAEPIVTDYVTKSERDRVQLTWQRLQVHVSDPEVQAAIIDRIATLRTTPHVQKGVVDEKTALEEAKALELPRSRGRVASTPQPLLPL